MYFVGSNCDSYSASVIAVMYAISCYIGPHYNGTRLYFASTMYVYFDIDDLELDCGSSIGYALELQQCCD